jgi:hypothetical protein
MGTSTGWLLLAAVTVVEAVVYAVAFRQTASHGPAVEVVSCVTRGSHGEGTMGHQGRAAQGPLDEGGAWRWQC